MYKKIHFNNGTISALLKKKKKKTFFAFLFNSPGVPNAFLNAQMLHVVFHIITIICSLFD